ncbi:MAG TPA: hypothetical protein VHB69_07440 [Mycobacteriales bacterium]|nr:hypothetical protein [Mycobacteriales bacterium]
MPQSDPFQTKLAAVTDAHERLVARLTRLSPMAWRSRRAAAEEVLRALAAISARQQGRDLPAPVVEVHVLPYAVAVVGRDVLDTTASASDLQTLQEVEAALRSALEATR